jgi:hypothetical protein
LCMSTSVWLLQAGHVGLERVHVLFVGTEAFAGYVAFGKVKLV